MAGPKVISKEDYREFRRQMEAKYRYEDMSDEEKEEFNSKIDRVAKIRVENPKIDSIDSDAKEKKLQEKISANCKCKLDTRTVEI